MLKSVIKSTAIAAGTYLTLSGAGLAISYFGHLIREGEEMIGKDNYKPGTFKKYWQEEMYKDMEAGIEGIIPCIKACIFG